MPAQQASAADFGGVGLAQIGEAVSTVGQSAAHAQRILQYNKSLQEVTAADMEINKANADLTIQLHTMARDWKPGDADITDTFDGLVKQRFELIGIGADGSNRFETAQAQQHFDKRAAHLVSQFTVETANQQAHLSGRQAVQDHRQMVDVGSNLLQLHPAYFDSTRQEMADAINNPNGMYSRIPATERAKMIREGEEQLATAAVLGQIRQTPLYAREQLQKGWMNTYIPNDKMPVLMQHAETAIHALEIDKDRAHKEAEWARVETARTIENSLFTKMAAHDADPKNPPLTAQDLIDSQLGLVAPEKYGAMIGVLHTRSREKLEGIRTDPGVMRGLFERIHLPEGDPRKITDEVPLSVAYGKQGKLTFEDLTRLRKELADARTPEGAKLGVEKHEFLAGIKTSITQSNPMLGKLDPDGDTSLYRFQFMVDRKIEEYRKAGKDPHDLFDPEKPEYLGKPERLKPFQKTIQQSIQSISKRLSEAGKTVPDALPENQMRRPGETYGEWRERVLLPGSRTPVLTQ
jgi:hypothetical protein